MRYWQTHIRKKSEQRPEGIAGWQMYNLISDCVEWVGTYKCHFQSVFNYDNFAKVNCVPFWGLFTWQLIANNENFIDNLNCNSVQLFLDKFTNKKQ